jgi:hypothetical protein
LVYKGAGKVAPAPNKLAGAALAGAEVGATVVVLLVLEVLGAEVVGLGLAVVVVLLLLEQPAITMLITRSAIMGKISHLVLTLFNKISSPSLSYIFIEWAERRAYLFRMIFGLFDLKRNRNLKKHLLTIQLNDTKPTLRTGERNIKDMLNFG